MRVKGRGWGVEERSVMEERGDEEVGEGWRGGRERGEGGRMRGWLGVQGGMERGV